MSVSMHMVRAVASAVQLAGGDHERFLAECGIATAQLESHAAWIPVADYVRVLEAANEVTGDSVLGLHLGEQTSSVMFQLLAHLVEHSATLGDALDAIVRYTGLLAQDHRPRVIALDDRVALRFPWLSGDNVAVRTMAELAMTGLLRLLRQYVGEAASLAQVSFAYLAPARVDEYRRVFRGRERFGQAFTELRFPRAWLDRSQLHSNPELHFLLKSHADRALALQRNSTICARIEALLATNDPRTLPDMSAVARTLGMSSRTLARKLSSEGVTFAELTVKRRRSAAQRLLALRVLSVQEVADAMGFTDAPAFHKAFKRWTGLTPRQYAGKVTT